MPTAYNDADVTEFVTERLQVGKQLTEKDVAIIKNTLGALAELQGQVLFMRRELDMAGGDVAELGNMVRDAGTQIDNLLADFKPDRDSFNQQELSDTVAAITKSVGDFNQGVHLFAGLLSKVPMLF